MAFPSSSLSGSSLLWSGPGSRALSGLPRNSAGRADPSPCAGASGLLLVHGGQPVTYAQLPVTFDLLQFESPLPVWMGTVGSSSVSLPGICVDFCVMILHILKKFFSYRWLLLVILLLSVTLFPPFNFVEAEMFF